MSNLQLHIAVGLPVLAIVTSMVVSLVAVAGIREQISAIREDIREIRADLRTLIGEVIDLANRVTRIEEKLGITPR